MLSHIDSTYLYQLTAAQIQEILVLKGVLIQQYQSHLHRWLTIVQLPDLGQLALSLEPETAAEIDLQLQQSEIVEFTAMTTVMNINICDRYVFIPLVTQVDTYGNNQRKLWGRICLVGNAHSVWTSQDLSWVQALGQQLLTSIDMLAACEPTQAATVDSTSPLSYFADSIERVGELEAICQRKDDFINNIAHDLRAPLTNIKMAMLMLKTSLQTDPDLANLLSGHPAEKYLAVLEQECDREVALINNVLDLQQLELSIDNLNIEAVEIKTLVLKVLDPFIHRASASSQQLVTSISASIPIVTTDIVCLSKIFTELLNNACKYTQVDGKILVSIDGDATSEWLTIIVKNQAEISAQYLPHIFTQFYRIPGRNRSQQGTGLGLSLVQKLVQQLNGQIDVTSTDGWTKFAVKIPTKY